MLAAYWSKPGAALADPPVTVELVEPLRTEHRLCHDDRVRSVEPTSSRRWLLWPAVVVVLVAGLTGVVVLVTGSSDADPRGLREQLASRVVYALEQSSHSEHAEHGHNFDEHASGILCAADAFGFYPSDATTVDEVRVVYADHMCAETGPGRRWPEAVRAAGPLAVEFADEITVHLPERALPDDKRATHAERIRALFPKWYHDEALASDGLADPEVAEQLRERFEAER